MAQFDSTIKYPKDVAQILDERLDVWRFDAETHDVVRHWNPRPSLVHLDELMEAVFLSSFSIEEGRVIRFALVYQDPANAERAAWTTMFFEAPVPLSVESLRRLAPAVDPSSSWLGVFPDQKGNLVLWGIVHPGTGEDARHEPLGLQIRLVRPGFIIIRRELVDLLHYHLGSVTFFDGPFPTNAYPLNQLTSDVIMAFNKAPVAYLGQDCLSSIAARITESGHGGTLLAVPDITQIDSLSFRKHRFPSLSQSVIQQAFERTLKTSTSSDTDLTAAGNQENSAATESVTPEEERKRRRNLTSILEFIAKLASIDGALLMSHTLEIAAFGAIIDFNVGNSENSCLVQELILEGGGRYTEPRELSSLGTGTRHQSAAFFCSRNRGALAYVASQDGTLTLFCSRQAGPVVFVRNLERLGAAHY